MLLDVPQRRAGKQFRLTFHVRKVQARRRHRLDHRNLRSRKDVVGADVVHRLVDVIVDAFRVRPLHVLLRVVGLVAAELRGALLAVQLGQLRVERRVIVGIEGRSLRQVGRTGAGPGARR